MPHTSAEKRRQYVSDYGKRKRREARERKAHEKATMERSPLPPPDFEPPVLVHAGEDLAPTASPARSAGSVPAPAPAPLPSLEALTFTPHEAFQWDVLTPLSPSDRDVVTEFNNKYMQKRKDSGLDGMTAEYQAARDKHAFLLGVRREATAVLPLLQQQYEVECRGLDGPNGGEAQAVGRNLQWVKEVLLPKLQQALGEA